MKDASGIHKDIGLVLPSINEAIKKVRIYEDKINFGQSNVTILKKKASNQKKLKPTK